MPGAGFERYRFWRPSADPEQARRFLRASLRGWQWAIDHREAAVDMMLARFPAMAKERAFHLASFTASLPLIIPGGKRLGSIDCQRWLKSPALATYPVKEELCTIAILQDIWESDQ